MLYWNGGSAEGPNRKQESVLELIFLSLILNSMGGGGGGGGEGGILNLPSWWGLA